MAYVACGTYVYQIPSQAVISLFLSTKAYPNRTSSPVGEQCVFAHCAQLHVYMRNAHTAGRKRSH